MYLGLSLIFSPSSASDECEGCGLKPSMPSLIKGSMFNFLKVPLESGSFPASSEEGTEFVLLPKKEN
jgi:hypothetical protein